MSVATQLALIVLDGWGYRKQRDGNAIAIAHTPVYDQLWRTAPKRLLNCSGSAVGLPEGQMGNSEVGHSCIGAGRVLPQQLEHLNQALDSGTFFRCPALCEAVDKTCASGGAVHLLGLLSPGGVHSHERHLHAALQLALERGAQVFVHAFLDGRDTAPCSASDSLSQLEQLCANSHGRARIASIVGRYYAMDRDRRWERTEQAWRLVAQGVAEQHADTATAALVAAYTRGESDEFVQPTAIAEHSTIKATDGIVFMNFRADRARQLSSALLDESFNHFERPGRAQLRADHFVTATDYGGDLKAGVAFRLKPPENTLGACLAHHGLRQLRMAETEKFAHVSYFLNGGQEAPFPGEERQLVPSPQVATYDLQPEMSAPELTQQLVDAITTGRHDVIICNYANGDMVGHTGKLEAAVVAVECIDGALGQVLAAIEASGAHCLITADHGNCESMATADGTPHTAHTLDPVPLIYAGPQSLRAATADGQWRVPHGSLADVAPTALWLLDMAPPAEMSGQPLFTSV